MEEEKVSHMRNPIKVFLKSKDKKYNIQTALSLIPAVEEDERVDQRD